MGDVLLWRPRPSKPKTEPMKPLKSDNLAYPSDKDMAESKAITDALRLHHGLDVEIVPEDGA
jgi:hypothetical protein